MIPTSVYTDAKASMLRAENYIVQVDSESDVTAPATDDWDC